MIRNVMCGMVLLGAGLALGALTDKAEAGEMRGPQVRRGTLSPGDRQDTFTFRFRSGELATILVNNTSNCGDINLVVEDDNGRVIARDFRCDDDASVAFYPRRTGTYYVKVRYSRSSSVLRYTLTTN